MKIKTSELTGAALDWAVGSTSEVWEPEDLMANLQEDDDGSYYGPSTNWAQGGPIIEYACIELSVAPCGYMGVTPGAWLAFKGGADFNMIEGEGRTPLIAAMRCYVASKLGDEVEVPDELL